MKKTRNSNVPQKHNKLPVSLEQVELSGTSIRDALTSAAAGTFLDNLPVISRFWSALDRLSQALRNQKIDTLFRRYGRRFESIDAAATRLEAVLGTRAGQSLFSKIVQILDRGINDEEWIGLLANLLKKMSDGEFMRLFGNYSYVLAQIEKLSPQSLVVLSKYERWKNANIGSTSTSSGQTLSGDWDMQASNFLAHDMRVTDSAFKIRIAHSFSELEKAGLIVLTHDKLSVTPIGGEVYRLISG